MLSEQILRSKACPQILPVRCEIIRRRMKVNLLKDNLNSFTTVSLEPVPTGDVDRMSTRIVGGTERTGLLVSTVVRVAT